jgi:uncharacterized protein YaiL (DUF2058 family)
VIRNLLRIAEDAAVKRIHKKRQVVAEAADDEMPRQAHRLELESDPSGDKQVDEAQRERQAGAAFEGLVDKAVTGIGVILGVAMEAPLVEQHAVQDAAFGARG